MISGDSSIIHLKSDDEEFYNEAAKLISEAVKGSKTHIAKSILEKIDVAAPSNLVLRLCRVFFKAKETTRSNLFLSKIADVCFENIYPGLSKKTIQEQIAFAKDTGQQAEFVQLLVYRSESLRQVFTHWSGLGLELQENLELCLYVASQGSCLAARELAEHFDKLGLERTEIKDRLRLCKIIAGKGRWVTNPLVSNFDKLGFLEDIKKPLQERDRLELCHLIASQGRWAAEGLALFINFTSFGLENVKVEDRLGLCKTIASQCIFAAECLRKKFDRLDFFQEINKLQPVEKRLELCGKIASQGEWAAWGLVLNFSKLELEGATVEDLFGLCKIIELQSVYAAECLLDNFDKLGFLQEINKLKPLEKRLELCGRIAAQGQWAESGLVRQFKMLGILEDINMLPQEEDRLKLCKVISSQGQWAAWGLGENFNKLELESITVGDRLELCKMIAVQGRWAVRCLAQRFKGFGLASATVGDRLELCKVIALQPEAGASLASHFAEFELGSATVEDRLALCKIIGTQGFAAEENLYSNFPELGFLQDIKILPQVEDRIKLCTKIASQGRWAAWFLTLYYKQLGLEGATVEGRLELCKVIAAYGGDAERILAENFDKFGLQEAEGACVSLAQFYAAAGYQRTFDCRTVSLSITNDTIKRQVYLELWRPPSEYREESQESLSAGFTSELAPILNVLHRKEGVPFSTYKESLAIFLNKNEKFTWLLPLLEHIEEAKEDVIQFALLDFMAYAVGVLYDLTEGQLEAVKQSGMVQVLFKHESPLNRYRFMRLLSDVAKHNPGDLMSMPIRQEWHHAFLTRVLLSPLFDPEESAAAIEKIIERIDVKAFKPISKFNSIVQLLLSINNHRPYRDSELSLIRKAVADVIGQKKGKKSDPVKIMLSKINSLTTLLNVFGKEEFLNCLREKKNPMELLRSHFQQFFNVGEVQQFGEKYQSTFGKFRDEEALFTYARCVNSLPSDQKERVRNALNVYVRAVLEGTFPGIRYDTTSSPHLAQVFSAPDIQNKWCAQQQASQVSMAYETPLGMSDYKIFFIQKVLTDEHIDPQLLPRLVSYLNTEQVEIVDSQEPLEQLQNFAIQLLRGEENVEEFIRKVVALGDIPAQFLLDLEALNPKKGAGDCTIQESDDACDLLLIGKEIKGSCQSIYGSPHLNKCLVSYLMNGEVRPIVIKQNDRLVARSVMRLMWDRINQMPVILLERVYSNVAGSQPAKHILEWAKQKAESMGLPLVCKEVGDGSRYQGDVRYLGGFSPFVYSDASGGVCEGPFRTERCHALYLPTKGDK